MGVSSSAYHEGKGERGKLDFRVSPSMLKTFMANPQKWIRGYSSPDSDSKRWGNLLDCHFLTPERFDESYVCQPETYETTGMECPSCLSVSDSKTCAKCKTARVEKKITKEWNNNSNTCAEWVAKQNGKTIITNDENIESARAMSRLYNDSIISSFRQTCDTQVHVIGEWHDESGVVVPVECLIDLVPRKDSEFSSSLGDLKTTTNASLRAFSRWTWTAGYHIQGAFDLDLFNEATGEGRSSWVFVLSENYAPYETGRRLLSQDFLTMGQQYYKAALKRYCQCLKKNEWPSYDDNLNACQGWSLISPEPYMQFEQMSEAMEQEQQAATEHDPDDIIP